MTQTAQKAAKAPAVVGTRRSPLKGRRSTARIEVQATSGNASPNGTRSTVLAIKLRDLRSRYGLTLKELAHRTGVSASTLSKIENGQLSPTYEKIVSLANGLDLEVADLFGPVAPPLGPGRREVTRKGAGMPLSTMNYEYEFLCPDLREKKFIPVFARIKAHAAREFPALPRHQGEEFVYVLRGSVTVLSEFYEPLHLNPGDSCYFDSAMGHALISAGAHDADVLWVSSKGIKLPTAAD